MSDIVQRLRDQGKDAFAKHYSLGMFKLCDEAATEIERLREVVNREIDRADLFANSIPAVVGTSGGDK